MEISTFEKKHQAQVIDLILDIQNNEAGIGLTLEEQPDLLDIEGRYIADGGVFLTAIEDDAVVGTIGLMMAGSRTGILKKFFVRRDWRTRRIGLALFERLMEHARGAKLRCIVLDTPSVARKSHSFYERAGFVRVSKDSLPIKYEYPDRDSILYMLILECDE